MGDERALLAALRSGDRAAADQLVDYTYGGVFAALCKMTGDRELASDLTQDTYQKAWQSISSFDGRARLSTWLYRIAYTSFLNHLRRPRLLQPLDERTDPADERAERADQRLLVEEQTRRLHQAVLALPEDLRFTVTAHFWADLSVKEIAQIEMLTTVAIRKRLARAFSLLQPLLEEESS